MKYIVITSKHHDGFALFDSKVSRYDVVDATPSKRDMLKELAAACAKHGHAARLLLLAGPGLARARTVPATTWDFGPRTRKKDFDKYLRAKAEPQVRELLTDYGRSRSSGSTRRA